MYSETVHCFGDGNILSGILTQPTDIVVKDLCVVFLNAGLVHRIGPFRMHVDMARALAQTGIPSFRFDLSGLGDSLRRDCNLADEERAVLDIQEAFDHLKDITGINSFITFGLCSGADNAHAVALIDQRLVGAVMLDGPAYPNLQYKVSHYAPKIMKLKSWKTMAKGLMNGNNQPAASQAVYVRTFAPREQVESEINIMISRGVELLYIYSGGFAKYYNHALQFKENFPSIAVNTADAHVQCDFFEHADHTYPDLGDRKLLTERVIRWVQEKYIKPEALPNAN